MKITIPAEIDLDVIAEALSQEQARSFIELLDLTMADYEFTESLAKYLINQLVIERENDHGSEPFLISELYP